MAMRGREERKEEREYFIFITRNPGTIQKAALALMSPIPLDCWLIIGGLFSPFRNGAQGREAH